MLRRKKKTWCHHLWVWFCILHNACNWYVTSTPRICVVYSRCIGDIRTSSRCIPFLLGTVGINMQGYLIGIAWVDKSNTIFLSFYKTHAILWLSWIFHSKVACVAFLNVPLYFNASGNPTQLDRSVPITSICMEANSCKSPTDVKKLSIVIICLLPCTSWTKSNTTFWTNFASPRATRVTSSLPSSFSQYTAKFHTNLVIEHAMHQILMPHFWSFCGMHWCNGQ